MPLKPSVALTHRLKNTTEYPRIQRVRRFVVTPQCCLTFPTQFNTSDDPTEYIPVFLHLPVMLINAAPVSTVNLDSDVHPSKKSQFHRTIQMTIAALMFGYPLR